MLDLSSQEHERPSPRQEGQVSSPPSQGTGSAGMRCGLGRDGFYGKRSADVGSRVDNEAAVGRPRGIDEYSWKEERGSDRRLHAEKVWYAVVVRRRGDGLAVGRPCWSALQVERIATIRAFVPSACITCKSVCPCCRTRMRHTFHRGDRRAAKDSRSRTTPQLRVRPVGGLPDTLARAGRRNIQKIIWTQSWREPRAGRQRDSSRRRRLGG